jgi:DNA-binding NtrC family response regulator
MNRPCLRDHSDSLPTNFDLLSTAQVGHWREVCAGCAYELGKQHAAVIEERREQYLSDVRKLHLPASVSEEAVVSSAAFRADTSISDLLPNGLDLQQYLDAIEKRILEMALQRVGSNKTEAARLLGLTFRSLRYRLAKYGMAQD